MLELRLTADAKRVASMRDAIRRECERRKVGSAHAELIALVAEQLVDGNGGECGGRRSRRGARASEVFVIVTVQSDATMLMVRDPRPDHAELGDRRRRLLEEHTSRWSTISGRDGRTIWAEIARAAEPERTAEPPASVATRVEATGANPFSRPERLRLGVMPNFATPD